MSTPAPPGPPDAVTATADGPPDRLWSEDALRRGRRSRSYARDAARATPGNNSSWTSVGPADESDGECVSKSLMLSRPAPRRGVPCNAMVVTGWRRRQCPTPYGHQHAQSQPRARLTPPAGTCPFQSVKIVLGSRNPQHTAAHSPFKNASMQAASPCRRHQRGRGVKLRSRRGTGHPILTTLSRPCCMGFERMSLF